MMITLMVDRIHGRVFFLDKAQLLEKMAACVRIVSTAMLIYNYYVNLCE